MARILSAWKPIAAAVALTVALGGCAYYDGGYNGGYGYGQGYISGGYVGGGYYGGGYRSRGYVKPYAPPPRYHGRYGPWR